MIDTNQYLSEIIYDIVVEYQSLSKKELKAALRGLVEAVKREAIEKINNSIYYINQI